MHPETDLAWFTRDWVAWRLRLAKAKRARRRLLYRRDNLGQDVRYPLGVVEARLRRLELSEP